MIVYHGSYVQICFCTEKALNAISFKESYIVETVNWRDI